jgi:hypothetical protein
VERRFPVYLSVALPGLGQIYLKKHAEGAMFFIGFIALFFIPYGFWFFPALALAAGYRARKILAGVETTTSRVGRVLFGACAGCAAIFWLTTSFSKFVSSNSVWDNALRADAIAQALKRCFASSPSEQCGVEIGEQNGRDSWGNRFQLKAGEGEFTLYSAGKDLTFNTSDDISYRYSR